MPNIVETINKVHSFSEIENGWHFGEGETPSARVRSKAIDLLHDARARGLSRSNAFPGINGEIQITFYHQDSVLELTFETDGSITIAEDEGREQVFFEEGLSIADAIMRLEEFSQKLWDISGSFIVGTTIRNAATFQVRRSALQAMAVSQFSTGPARRTAVELPANTFQGSTEFSLATQQSTGRYQTIFSLATVESREPKVPLEMNAITTFLAGLEQEREKRLLRCG